ncbi:hypothetical protein GTE16_004416 [Salmonella enterica subsp. enterica]|nr:hypothetical protein [Salmonella enterica]EDY1644175.1 hypothetical protein [Salmonella enterica subsp. enterica]
MIRINIEKMAAKHSSKPMKQHSVNDAKKLISAIETELESKLETAISKYRREISRANSDMTISISMKNSIIDNAEYELLAAHEIIGSITTALDNVLDNWEKLGKYLKTLGE